MSKKPVYPIKGSLIVVDLTDLVRYSIVETSCTAKKIFHWLTLLLVITESFSKLTSFVVVYGIAMCVLGSPYLKLPKFLYVAVPGATRERYVTAEQTRIAGHEDRCLRGSLREQQSLRQVSVDTEHVHVPAHCHTWKRVGKTVGPCIAVLCVDMDTVHGCCMMTGLPLFCSKQVCCMRSAE